MNITGSTIAAAAIGKRGIRGFASGRFSSGGLGFDFTSRWPGSGLGVEAKHSRITPVRPSSGCVARSLVGEVEGPPLRVDATKIAVLLLAGLFKIEHILENAPTLWGLWHSVAARSKNSDLRARRVMHRIGMRE
jgi:hypothetical protein